MRKKIPLPIRSRVSIFSVCYSTYIPRCFVQYKPQTKYVALGVLFPVQIEQFHMIGGFRFVTSTDRTVPKPSNGMSSVVRSFVTSTDRTVPKH